MVLKKRQTSRNFKYIWYSASMDMILIWDYKPTKKHQNSTYEMILNFEDRKMIICPIMYFIGEL